ncbi:methylated-DNA--[protein]-cysteine S-methyltransferase [Prosthecobacter sp.]|uniref:bifunctional transcriptional activator/DNA repair enzyme AdaA n=1 Tax=Prosthecobacter sp. TaxID=1965333 RepID=UPI001DA45CB9|nr:methylated-DNA--[protein]-cysteine S-methyltransferase [Prosthecobacter sp.]MCB1276527.1 methylated-DNA--[protein]-cysteine S-methyltransferase [Prosthecobacter sp.]
MNDYERVAQIIRHLDAHQTDQPSLDELAVLAGLSRFHFHRLFSRWAGVTPKEFLQCLTLENARERLRNGESVLDAALNAGLSSPGRLHELCVTLEAATPGEIKSGGAGWRIEAGFAETPFGMCCIGTGPRGICHLAFLKESGEETAKHELMRSWPRAEWQWDNAKAEELTARVFQSDSGTPLKAIVRGTPFQLRVWRALVRIPAGALVSYGHLATVIGHQGAARAVGTAVGSNPLAYLIPCHRVIRETGVIGQYRWGQERKRVLLGWEALRH